LTGWNAPGTLSPMVAGRQQRKTPRTWRSAGSTAWGEGCIDVGKPLGRWQVEMQVVIRHGRPVIAELLVRLPMDDPKKLPSKGLTSSDLRNLRTREDLARAIDWAYPMIEQGHPAPSLTSEVADELRLAGQEPGPGRGIPPSDPVSGLFPAPIHRGPVPASLRGSQQGKPRGTDFYARVAADYVEAYARSNGQPNVYLAERYSKEWGEPITRQMVAQWVHQARVLGFLSSPTSGIGGGRPTKKLQKWLAEQEEER
jgi:hypothetical protein